MEPAIDIDPYRDATARITIEHRSKLPGTAAACWSGLD
jgi:hypothetical protein